jgi:hypothetical protein
MRVLALASLFLFAITAASVWAADGAPGMADDFDRLDGTGPSGKRVDVIEWEGNLEVHVYPAGALRGLGLKLDQKNGKDVMVISYRFDNTPRPLVRRAILGIPLREGFQAYRDPSAGTEYDKIVITNNRLGAPLVAFRLDAEPKQLYPDGHPALAQGKEVVKKTESRRPAEAAAQAPSQAEEDEGRIRPFGM